MKRILVFLSIVFSLPASANGLHIWQLSGSHVGDNAAGAAAIAKNATTAYYNPAGLPNIQYQDLALSLISQLNSVEFNGTIETDTTTSGIIQGGQTVLLPNLQYAAPISEKWGFGFSVTTPFSLKLDYGKDAFSRDLITQMYIATTNLGLSLGYKAFKYVSFGIGVDAQYLKFRYDRIDAKIPAQTGMNKNKLSNWEWGFNGSVLLTLPTKTRIGVNYHSKMKHHLSGNSQFSFEETINKTRVNSTLVLPAFVMLSLYQDVTEQVALLGSVQYTKWSSFKPINLNNVATATTSINITLLAPLKDTWGFSLGTHYFIDSKTTLRVGVGYDQASTNNRSRSLIIPEVDRYTASIGLGYQITHSIGFDVGYSHIFMPHKAINHTQSINSQNIVTTGQLNNDEDIIGIQFNWKMT